MQHQRISSFIFLSPRKFQKNLHNTRVAFGFSNGLLTVFRNSKNCCAVARRHVATRSNVSLSMNVRVDLIPTHAHRLRCRRRCWQSASCLVFQQVASVGVRLTVLPASQLASLPCNSRRVIVGVAAVYNEAVAQGRSRCGM